MVARRPPEKSELFSLLGAPQVTQRSVTCSAPSSLLHPILDCSVLSWLFDAYHSVLLDTLPAARIGTLGALLALYRFSVCRPLSRLTGALMTTLHTHMAGRSQLKTAEHLSVLVSPS